MTAAQVYCVYRKFFRSFFFEFPSNLQWTSRLAHSAAPFLHHWAQFRFVFRMVVSFVDSNLLSLRATSLLPCLEFGQQRAHEFPQSCPNCSRFWAGCGWDPKMFLAELGSAVLVAWIFSDWQYFLGPEYREFSHDTAGWKLLTLWTFENGRWISSNVI